MYVKFELSTWRNDTRLMVIENRVLMRIFRSGRKK